MTSAVDTPPRWFAHGSCAGELLGSLQRSVSLHSLQQTVKSNLTASSDRKSNANVTIHVPEDSKFNNELTIQSTSVVVSQSASKEWNEEMARKVTGRVDGGGVKSCLTAFIDRLPSMPRNNSYTCLAGLVTHIKHQRSQSPLAAKVKVKLPSAVKQDSSPISPADSGYESDHVPSSDDRRESQTTGVQRRGFKFPVQTTVIESGFTTLTDKCSHFAVKGLTDVDCNTQHVTNDINIQIHCSNQRSVCLESSPPVRSIDVHAVFELLQVNPASVLILDCRTFVSYNANHIVGALNVSCADAISRKRLLCGRVSIGDMVSGGEEAKRKFREAVEDPNVLLLLYDDNTVDFESLPATHSLHVVVHCLRKSSHDPVYLPGGLQAFYKNYRQLCSLVCEPQTCAKIFSPTTPDVDSNVDSAVISEILPMLYIGNERDASNKTLLASLGITHVLNVTSHIPLFFETDGSFIYKRLPASDSGCQNLKQYFNDAIRFIDEAASRGGKVLVHCQAGVSRSSTIAIAYIMTRSSMRMLDAFRFVKSRRSVVAPNFNFMGQLLELEASLPVPPRNDNGDDPDQYGCCEAAMECRPSLASALQPNQSSFFTRVDCRE